MYSPNSLSKYDLVKIISDVYELDVHVTAFKTDKHVDKTITSIYSSSFIIPELFEQIKELKDFQLE